MVRKQFGALHLWQFDHLSTEAGIKHFVTDRHSRDEADEFTMSYSSHPDRDFVYNNRVQVAQALGVEPKNLFLPSQVHLTRIVEVSASTTKEELMDTDALITNHPGIGIAVMSADCVPILLFDKKNQAVGAVHSGWRGTVAHILEKTLLEMNRIYGTVGKDVVAAIGPSVCQQAYEVGEEVVKAVRDAFDHSDALMEVKANNRAKLDLWMANKVQLQAFGVPESQIEVSNLCTVLQNSNFFSARCGDRGRFAAGIVLTR